MFHTWDVRGMMEGMDADQLAYWSAYYRIKKQEDDARLLAAKAEREAQTPIRR